MVFARRLGPDSGCRRCDEASAGMSITAAESDVVDEQACWLVASGVVAHAPDWLECAGSTFVLELDERSPRHERSFRQTKNEE